MNCNGTRWTDHTRSLEHHSPYLVAERTTLRHERCAKYLARNGTLDVGERYGNLPVWTSTGSPSAARGSRRTLGFRAARFAGALGNWRLLDSREEDLVPLHATDRPAAGFGAEDAQPVRGILGSVHRLLALPQGHRKYLAALTIRED